MGLSTPLYQGYVGGYPVSQNIAPVRMDESADARRILTAVPQSEWRRPVGPPYTSWMATLKNDLALHNLADSQRRIGYSPLIFYPIPSFGEKLPCAAVRVLNENNCTVLHTYTVTVNIRCKFV